MVCALRRLRFVVLEYFFGGFPFLASECIEADQLDDLLRLRIVS